jgi:acetolactate synthase-1/2/3 large subunit
MANMTGAQALVRSLAREGVQVIFALPGVQIMHALDALHGEPGIRLVTVRHEQSTTFMADGYARTTGKVGVGLVVPGPGALNATAGLGTAYATSSPVLLISGQIESYNLGKERGALHEV